MKYFESFSGVGGFRLGIEKVIPDAECVGYSEIDKNAISVYSRHYPESKNYGDIKNINYGEVPDFDLLVGGSPCQDLSVAGKQAGLFGERSGLFFEFIRCLEEKKPKYFIWENVKGALSSNNGWDFARVQIEFSNAGFDFEWQVLNSKDFGVPQNRQRIFVVGHSRGTPRPQVFPIFGTDKATNKSVKIIAHRKGYRRNTQVFSPDGITEAMDTGQGGGRGHYTAIPVLTPDRLVKRQNGRRFKTDGEPALTLTAQDRHGVFDGLKIRRLTPIECEKLQGFPCNWTELDATGRKVSDSQRYKMMGNAVTTNVITEIIRKLL